MKMIAKRASGTTIIYYIAFLTYINVTEIADVYVYIHILSSNLIRDLSSKKKERVRKKIGFSKGFFFIFIDVCMSERKGLIISTIKNPSTK